MCAAGATLGTIVVAGELAYHVIPPADVLARTAFLLCAGVLLGLWIPRRIVRRRLESEAGGALPDPIPAWSATPDFAASLTGTLVVIFALGWGAAAVAALWMEEFRGLLAGRLLQTMAVKRTLLFVPTHAALLGAGAVGGTLLAALHGWQRLICRSAARFSSLWVSLALGVLGAGLLARTAAASQALLAWLSVLGLFLAALIAVARRWPPGATAPLPRPARRIPHDDRLALVAAGLAAALAVAAMHRALPADWVGTADLSTVAAVLGLASCAALAAVRSLPARYAGPALVPFTLLVAALAAITPLEAARAAGAAAALVRLALVVAGAALCLVAVSRAGADARGVQAALFRVGAATAVGGIACSLVMVTIGTRWGVAAGCAILSLVATAGAGVLLTLDSRLALTVRGMGLALVAVGFLLSPAVTQRLSIPAHRPYQQSTTEEKRGGAGPVRRLLCDAGIQTACVRLWPSSLPPFGSWDFDLSVTPPDLVIVEEMSEALHAVSARTGLGARLLRRAAGCLAGGGRLAIELPTAPSIAAALPRFHSRAAHSAWAGWRLGVRDGGEEQEALVYGGDIPALVERRRWATGLDVSLGPLTDCAGSGR